MLVSAGARVGHNGFLTGEVTLRISFICLAALLCAPISANAQTSTQGSWYAGGMLNQGGSGYAGVTLGVLGNDTANGLAARLSGYISSYEYMSGATRIDGQDTGGQLAALYQWSGDWGWANFGAGGRYVSVDLSPNDPGNTRKGSSADALLLTDGGYLNDGWRADWYGEYGVDQEAYFTRVGLSHTLNLAQNWHLGVEGSFQGDRYYSRSSAGALAIVDLDGGLELRASGGVTFQHATGDAGYAEITISQSF
jgi:hypothetical protein